jgi:hypothetical protein
METWYTDEQDYSATKAQLETIEPSLKSGQGATLAVTSGAAGLGTAGYAVEVTSKTSNKFKITKLDTAGGSTVARSCTTAGTYGCASGTKGW